MIGIRNIFLFFSNPFKALVLYFFSFLLLMAIWRTIFLASQITLLQFQNFLLYFESFWFALRLDAVVVSYLCIPIFITIFLPFIGWSSVLYRKIIFVYCCVIAFLYSFLSVIDIEFYKELGSHLNILAIQSNSKSKEFWQFAWNEYPILSYFIFILFLVFFWIRFIKNIIPKNKIKHSLFINCISFFFGLILIGTCIRGGWQERPIDWGHAMFSNNEIANQIALNPLFNFGRSIIQLNSEKNISEIIQYMNEDSAYSITRELILTSNEQYLDSLSFKRKIINPQSIQPNIVIIILESFLGSYCGFLNEDNKNVTPNLNNIAKKGINFIKTFASGKRSAYGLSSILCSWPVLPGFPIISKIESQTKIETIGSLLKEINYSTYFLIGGDADFDNMEGFVIANGYDKVIDKSDFPIQTPGTMWGIYDEYIFNKATDILDTSKTPTLITLFTATNHQPWEIPPNKEFIIQKFLNNHGSSEILRTMSYTDYVIGEFMQSNNEKIWFDNTIFVFISDHGINKFNGMYEDPRNAHIPFIIYSPSLINKVGIVKKITSQVDIVPTILHLIGYPEEYDLMGSNILADDYNGLACRIVNDYAMWLEEEFLYLEIFNQNKKLYKYSDLYNQPYSIIQKDDDSFRKIQNKFHAYLQTAYSYYKKR